MARFLSVFSFRLFFGYTVRGLLDFCLRHSLTYKREGGSCVARASEREREGRTRGERRTQSSTEKKERRQRHTHQSQSRQTKNNISKKILAARGL